MAFAIFFATIMNQLVTKILMCRIQDSPMTTFTRPCSRMEEEDRSDTHSGSGLSSKSGGSGPGSGGQ